MEVQLGDYLIPINVTRKNNKNIYFRIKEDGILYVTCNRFVREKDILNAIKENEKSFIRMYEHAMKRKKNNEVFHYLGEPYTICYNEDVKRVLIDNQMIYVKDEKMFNKWYKNECIRVFNDRIEYLLDEFRDIPEFSLRIRKMKTRWGVCNIQTHIITLNLELMKRDPIYLDYVIIHEMTHLVYGDHSKDFWNLVEENMPNYKKYRDEMKEF